jgi:hypothetical protein
MTAQLTRIKNDQIYDKTITANTKVMDRSVTGALLEENLVLNSTVTIQGNLTVTNNYIVTTTVNTNINDPLVIFNSGYVGSPTYDIGVLMNRNLAAMSNPNYGGLNAAWIWREADGSFEGILTTETGTTAGSINRTAYANLVIGNTIITTTAGEVVDSTSTGSGALQVVGGVGITANLNVGSTNDNWNTILGNSYFGTTTLTYPAGNQLASQQAVENIKTFTGSAFNLALINSDAAAHATFTQNTAAQGGQLSIVTYQSGNDINFSPNGFYALSLAAANGSVIVQPTTNSTAADPYHTGAVVSQGGVGIQGNINVFGNASIGGLVLGSSVLEAGDVAVANMFLGNSINTALIRPQTIAIGFNIGQGGAIGPQSIVIGSNIGTITQSGFLNTVIGTYAGQAGFGDQNTFIGGASGGLASGNVNTFLGALAGSAQSGGDYNVILGSYNSISNFTTAYPLDISNTSRNVVISDGEGNVRVWIDPAGTARFTGNTTVTHATPNTGAMVIEGGLGVLGNLVVAGNAIAVSNGLVIGGNTNSAGGTIYIGGNVLTASLGANSIVIGNQAGGSGSGANVTIVGDQAGIYNPGANDVLIGRGAGLSHTGVNSTFVGTLSGKNTTGSDNQFFGYNSGSEVTTGTKNVIVGAYDGNVFASLDNRVMISDGAGEPRIYIDNKGGVQVISSEESTSAYGALRVEGGASIAKKLHVGGNLVVSGNLFVMDTISYVNSDVVSITDPIILLNTGPNGAVLGTSVNFDVGVRARHWYNSASRDAFFGRIDSSDEWEFYADVTSESANVIAGTIGNIRVGGIHLSNAYNAIDKSGVRGRGAITTLGGASIALDTYIGGWTYNSGQTNTGNYNQTGATTTFTLTGTDTVTIAPATAAQVSTIDNMAIGQTTPANGKFSNLVVSSDGSGYNMTIQGSGFANIAPTGAVKINPGSLNGQDSNMDNVFIGNTVPRDANITQANISYSLTLRSFTANSVLFVGPSGNLAVDQMNQGFNFQRLTGNTLSGIQLSLGTNNDFNGTDTLNIYYQGDSYLPQSAIAANTVGQSPGWTVATSRGTGHAPSTVQDGDFLGRFGAYGYTDAGDYQELGAWKYVARGDHTTGNGLGGEAQLWTKQDGTAAAGNIALRVDNNQVATFYGQVIIANTTGITNSFNNSSDGALYVQGVVGIRGNIVANAGLRVNDGQNIDHDTYIRGSNDATLIWARSKNSYNSVIIGNSATEGDLVTGAKLQIFSDDTILMPRGDNTGRPATPTPGMIRYNYVRNDMEYWNGTEWFAPQASQAAILKQNTFIGNGVQQVFTLSNAATSNSAWVSINGVIQIPGNLYSYTIENSYQLTFNEAPEDGDVIDVRIITVPAEFRGVYSLNNLVAFDALDQDFGANISTGDSYGNVSNVVVSFTNTGSVVYYGMGNILVGTSTATLHSFEVAKYRSAKYYIQVSNFGLSEYETSEVMVVHNGTTAYSTQYARIFTGASSLGTVGVTLSSGNVSLQFTGVNSGNYVKVRAEYTTGYN